MTVNRKGSDVTKGVTGGAAVLAELGEVIRTVLLAHARQPGGGAAGKWRCLCGWVGPRADGVDHQAQTLAAYIAIWLSRGR